MIRDAQRLQALLTDIRAFVRERWHPLEEQIDRSGEIHKPVVQELRRQGCFGWSIPEAYGGLGLTAAELVLCAFELSQASVALRARVGTNTGIGSEASNVQTTARRDGDHYVLSGSKRFITNAPMA